MWAHLLAKSSSSIPWSAQTKTYQPRISSRYLKARTFSKSGFKFNQATMARLRGGKTTTEPSDDEQSTKSTAGPAKTSPTATSETRMVEINSSSYTNRTTRILNLHHIPHLLSAKDTPESKYRQIFNDYVKSMREQSPPHADPLGRGLARNIKKKDDLWEEAQLLQAAISSLTSDNAPPVAFPTETVYGLGADATNASNVKGIFAAKGRPGDNPLIVHVSSIAHLERCLGGTEAEPAIPEVYKDLLAAFWPGPLTILVPLPAEGKGVKFAPNVHPGQKTIGFRMPKSHYARFLIALADRPIAAPSANSSGKPSPTTARHVKDDLNGKIDFILDGGVCDVGVESTVVDGLSDPPLILRPGGLSKGTLRRWGEKHDNIWQHVENGWEQKKGVKRKRESDETNGTHKKNTKFSVPAEEGNIYDSPTTQTPKNEYSDLDLEDDGSSAPRAPGMKYKHYAPTGRMFLFEPDPANSECVSVNKFYEKLGKLLNARNTEPNARTRDLGQLLKARAKGGPGMRDRISALPHEEVHNLTIGVLTSTSWPRFPELLSDWPTLFPGWWDSTANIRVVESLRMMEINLNNRTNNLPTRRVKIYHLLLGKRAETITKNLFANLRSCDSFKCDWIFVEAPSPSRRTTQNYHGGWLGPIEKAETDDDYETVLERMRKAASEIIQV